jgi:hypothetical protein
MREVKREDKGQVSGGEGQVMGEEKGRERIRGRLVEEKGR